MKMQCWVLALATCALMPAYSLASSTPFSQTISAPPRCVPTSTHSTVVEPAVEMPGTASVPAEASYCVADCEEKSFGRLFLETAAETAGGAIGGLIGGGVGLLTAGPGGAAIGGFTGAASGAALVKYWFQPTPAKSPTQKK